MKSTATKLISSFLHYFDEFGISRKSKFLLAFSGGPDSAVLLSLFANQLMNCHACYINHNLRPGEELEHEMKIAFDLAQRYGFPLHVHEVDNGAIKKKALAETRSTEDLAREYRYAALNMCMQQLGCDYICLGHTLDDQLETMIIRFFQGAGYQGLTGIPPRREHFLRPLISCEKKDILDYAKQEKICYSRDSTNEGDDFLRNKVRHALIPVVSSIFPGYKSSLPRLGEKITEEQSGDDELLANWFRNGKKWQISESVLQSFPVFLRKKMMYLLFDAYCPDELNRRLPWKFLKPLEGDLAGITDGYVLNGHGFSLRKSKDSFFWMPDVVDYSKKRYLIVVKEVKAGETSAELELVVNLPFRVYHETAVVINYDSLTFPVLIRNKQERDVIIFTTQKKAVKKIVSSFGLPESEQFNVPILEDKNGLIAVAGGVYRKKTLISSGYTIRGKRMLKILLRGRSTSAEE